MIFETFLTCSVTGKNHIKVQHFPVEIAFIFCELIAFYDFLRYLGKKHYSVNSVIHLCIKVVCIKSLGVLVSICSVYELLGILVMKILNMISLRGLFTERSLGGRFSRKRKTY